MSVATAAVGARPVRLRASVSPLLAAALVVATGWSVLAGGWTDGSASVLLVGALGAVVGLFLARSRTPRLVALASAPLLLLISLLPTNAGSRPLSGGTGLWHIIGQYGAAATTGLLGNPAWAFNVGLGALLWVCGAWAAWFAVRERRGALASGPCWTVIAVNVINAPSTSGVTVPAALAAGLALMLIAAVQLERLDDGWRRRQVSVLPGTGGRFATAALFGAALIVVLALVIPPLTSTDVSGRLFGGAGTGSGQGGRAGLGHGTNGATVRFSSATIPGGALALSDSPVLTYTSSLSTGVYLRMETDSVFDTGNFLPAQSANDNGDDAEEIVDPAGAIARDRSVADGGIGSMEARVSLNITLLDDTSDNNTLPFAGEPDAVSVPARVDGLTGPEVNGQLLTVDSVQALRSVIGTSFTTRAIEPTASADQLRRAGTSYPALVNRDFLGLQEDGTGGAAVIRALALQWTRGTTNAYDAATAIESTLRNPALFRYTLTPPAPPPVTRMWPVTYFLTVSHAGYCQYYAVAMGAMLRALGIPSRLVNGYGPGTAPNAAARRTSAENTWTVTSDDAHTWVEAYFPQYGWVPFEPTPPSQAGDYQPFGRGLLGATGVTGARPTSVPAPSRQPARSSVAPAPGAASTTSSRGRTALLAVGGAVAAALLLVGLFLAWFLAPRDVRGVWRRVGILGRWLGVPRDRALTFDEYAERLGTAIPAGGSVARRDRLADGLRDLALLSDRAFYAPPSTRPDAAALERAWRRVALLTPLRGHGDRTAGTP